MIPKCWPRCHDILVADTQSKLCASVTYIIMNKLQGTYLADNSRQ